MMTKRSFVFILFWLICSSLAAQNITISGKVVDRATKEALPFASVYIKDKAIGTITNLNGEFDFHISQAYRNEIFVVSNLGYSNYESPVWAVASNSPLTIELNPFPILLDEVVVKDSLTGGDIFRLALSRIRYNYPMKPFLMAGFYRDVKRVGGTYISLLEAAVEIFDDNYTEPRNKYKLREGVRLLEIRKSLGYESKFTTYFDQVNLLEDLLLHNDIRYRQFPEEDDFFNGLVRKPNTIFNGNIVYVLHYNNEYSLKLYIDRFTLGILHLDYESNETSDYQKKQSMISRFVHVKRVLNFNKIAGRLYPTYMSMDSKINWYDIETNELKFETILHQQLLVNQISPNTDKRIKSIEKMRNYSLQFQDQPYNKTFWDNYNIIKATPLDKKIIEDLEKAGPLDEQFEGKF
jgi:hypothetical protein